jgi:pilus assembly protein CpaE
MKSVIIGPDYELSKQLEAALLDLGNIVVSRRVDAYPSPVELLRILRAHAPDVILVNTDVLSMSLDLVTEVEKNFPGVQVVAFNRVCEQHALLEIMRAGVREYLVYPFGRQTLRDAIARIAEIAQRRPPSFESTDRLYAFLPSKPGVGASTVALNTSIALSRIPGCETLHIDLDLSSGVVRFLLKLDNGHAVTDAAEHAHRMDESMWEQMTAQYQNLHVLHAGPLNPDLRIEPVQLRHLLEFARRHYKVICTDLSGNLERYSFEIMNEAKKIFIVCTGELSSLHLAREKLNYLRSKDLAERAVFILNRCQKRSQFSREEVEEVLGVPVFAAFANDYSGVQRSVSNAKGIDANTEIGKQIAAFANSLGTRAPVATVESKGRKFIDYFSIVPARASAESRRSAG